MDEMDLILSHLVITYHVECFGKETRAFAASQQRLTPSLRTFHRQPIHMNSEKNCGGGSCEM